MMIDYTELPQDGTKFEQLIRELSLREGFIPHWTGEGNDGGRDLIIEEIVEGIIYPPFRRKWLVSCKHNAHASKGKAVGIADINGLTDSLEASRANGIILACSTHPSSSVIRRLEEIETKKKIPCIYWDGVDIEKRLMKPNTYSLVQLFFPKTASALEIAIYNAGSPNFWCGIYLGHFFYMSSRIAASLPNLTDIKKIVNCVEKINAELKLHNQFGCKNHLRTRSIHYDDKHCTYLVFVDFLVDNGKDIKQEFDHKSILSELSKNMDIKDPVTGEQSMNSPEWDVLRVKCSMLSDKFQVDDKGHYKKYSENFEKGRPRDVAASIYSSFPESWVDPIVTKSGMKILRMPCRNNE